MPSAIQDKIRRRFKASARQYDLFCGLHRKISEDLLARVIKEPVPSALLDVGCGTGYLTVKLKGHFPASKVIGLDFAEEMLKAARSKDNSIAWILADSHQLPFSDGCFDILVSNLAYQWAADLPRAFGEAHRVLASGGVLMFTLFGFHTCRELFQCLDQAKAGMRFIRLADQTQVRRALEAAGFKNPIMGSEEMKIGFKDMHELLAWLKAIGANNLMREGFIGRDVLSRAASIYRQQFSRHQDVEATFEVIRVYAKK